MQPNYSPWFIGIMSGTSLDGVDAVLARFPSTSIEMAAKISLAFSPAMRAEALALNSPCDHELTRTALFANQITDLYAEAVHQLLCKAQIPAEQIAAIGAHGQTLRHRPDLGFTLQALNGARLAEKTRISTICDFRSRDIAAGGQGAPLVPAFHQAIFAAPNRHRVILNLGGIANVSDLAPGEVAPLGFDTGPANVLLDLWCERHLGKAFDEDGAWAASGQSDGVLLQAMLAEPFFDALPPKSTGRDLFSQQWLATFPLERYAPADVQATLLALTATSITDAITRHLGPANEVFVCGGGAHNRTLMQKLQDRLPGVTVQSTAVLGLDPLSVEALAFAWLAQKCLAGEPGNLPRVTGAAGPRLLGAIYPR